MIKYKRIYPLRQNGHLACVVTAVGNGSEAEISVKFKTKPEQCDLVIIFFNPKTYDYEMFNLKEKLHVPHTMSTYTGCVIACKKGVFLEFLMEGAIGKTRISTSKLKSAIAMDMYTSLPSDSKECHQQCIPPDDNNNEERERHQQLVDYLNSPDSRSSKGSVLSAPPEQPPCGSIPSNVLSISKELEEAQMGHCEFVNPFKERWNGVWWRVQYPDKTWHYLIGRVLVDGENVSVLGVPGDRHTKPVCLESCDMFAVADNGAGYWLMFQPQ